MDFQIGSILDGKVTGITKFGAFIELGENKTGLVHISEVSSTYVSDINEHLTLNEQVKVKVVSISDDGKISLSIKKASLPPKNNTHNNANIHRGGGNAGDSKNMGFEDMMSKFKQTSDSKIHDLKKSIDGKRGHSKPRRPQ